ncbi:hypothetical protein [Allorhizobium ampelinum]
MRNATVTCEEEICEAERGKHDAFGKDGIGVDRGDAPATAGVDQQR